MYDRTSKNMFSDELVLGLHKHLFDIQQNKNIRAVILTGYDNIFCMGGSKDNLMDIAHGRQNFTDMPLQLASPHFFLQGHLISSTIKIKTFKRRIP